MTIVLLREERADQEVKMQKLLEPDGKWKKIENSQPCKFEMEGIGQEQIGNQEHLVEKEAVNSGEQPEWERADLQVSDI